MLFSCGFQVIYNEKSSGISYEKELASIKIEKSSGRLSQILRSKLYDTFNPDDLKVESKYYIVLQIKESESPTFLTSTGASGRNKITISISYQLFDLATNNLVSSGSTSANDNYDVGENRYGTYVAQKFTRDNLTKTLAQNIRDLLVNDIIELKKSSNNSN